MVWRKYILVIRFLLVVVSVVWALFSGTLFRFLRVPYITIFLVFLLMYLIIVYVPASVGVCEGACFLYAIPFHCG